MRNYFDRARSESVVWDAKGTYPRAVRPLYFASRTGFIHAQLHLIWGEEEYCVSGSRDLQGGRVG